MIEKSKQKRIEKRTSSSEEKTRKRVKGRARSLKGTFTKGKKVVKDLHQRFLDSLRNKNNTKTENEQSGEQTADSEEVIDCEFVDDEIDI